MGGELMKGVRWRPRGGCVAAGGVGGRKEKGRKKEKKRLGRK